MLFSCGTGSAQSTAFREASADQRLGLVLIGHLENVAASSHAQGGSKMAKPPLSTYGGGNLDIVSKWAMSSAIRGSLIGLTFMMLDASTIAGAASRLAAPIKNLRRDASVMARLLQILQQGRERRRGQP
jgi:hypothetical protein